MTIRELYTKICEYPELETLEQAEELRSLQWELIMYLLDQKAETFAIYKELEDHHMKLQTLIQKQMIEDHKPDKLPN